MRKNYTALSVFLLLCTATLPFLAHFLEDAPAYAPKPVQDRESDRPHEFAPESPRTVNVPHVLARRGNQFLGSWKIKVVPDEAAAKAGEKAFDDTLTFTIETFVSETFKPRGFEAGVYDVDVRGAPVNQYSADPKSESQGSLKWSGLTTNAKDIKGELVWTKPGGAELRYTYTGEKQ